ncbi:hypothetical protein ACFLYH_01535 [Candidatus Dependentiae bacterium]
MKKHLINSLFFLLLATNNLYCSNVNFTNNTPFSIEIESDIPAYPDPKTHINKNTNKEISLGIFFLRGIKVSVYIGDQIIESILEENLKQTLGFGSINYHIFAELENLGRDKFTDEYIFEVTFFLERNPKGLYFGGIIDTSKTIKVRTKDFEHFVLVKEIKQEILTQTN